MFKIGIAGFGFVGSALYNSINLGTDVFVYDSKYDKFNDQDELLYSDVVFICVGTPMGIDGMDTSAVNNSLTFLSNNDYTGLVVIKSTILPQYIKIPKNLNVVSNPEFLKEVSANDDFKYQPLVLIGGRTDLCDNLTEIYNKQFNISYINIQYVSFEEALIFKHLRNTKIAYDIMFLENIQGTVGNLKKYQNLFENLPVNVDRIHGDGFPGFGGNCLPKDVDAFNRVYNDKLTSFLLDFNKDIRKEG